MIERDHSFWHHRQPSSWQDHLVISLCAKGLTNGDIAAHLLEVYGQEIDSNKISRITETVIDDMNMWQSRPLDAIYPVIFIDGMRCKIRDGTLTKRVVYAVSGINMEGERDVLGIWIGPTGGESSEIDRARKAAEACAKRYR